MIDVNFVKLRVQIWELIVQNASNHIGFVQSAYQKENVQCVYHVQETH